jgi:hypothetical protein
MDAPDQAFENYLKQFEPRRPAALTQARGAFPLRVRRFAAVVAIAVCIAGSIWMVQQKPLSHRSGAETTQFSAQELPVSVLPLMPLTHLALESPARLDAKLSEASRNMLPDFQTAHSTLRVLAKE